MRKTFKENFSKIAFLILLTYSISALGIEKKNINREEYNKIGPILLKELLELRSAFNITDLVYADSILRSKGFVKDCYNIQSWSARDTKITVKFGPDLNGLSKIRKVVSISASDTVLRDDLEAIVELMKYDDEFYLSECNNLIGKYTFYAIRKDYNISISLGKHSYISID